MTETFNETEPFQLAALTPHKPPTLPTRGKSVAPKDSILRGQTLNNLRALRNNAVLRPVIDAFYSSKGYTRIETYSKDGQVYVVMENVQGGVAIVGYHSGSSATPFIELQQRPRDPEFFGSLLIEEAKILQAPPKITGVEPYPDQGPMDYWPAKNHIEERIKIAKIERGLMGPKKVALEPAAPSPAATAEVVQAVEALRTEEMRGTYWKDKLAAQATEANGNGTAEIKPNGKATNGANGNGHLLIMARDVPIAITNKSDEVVQTGSWSLERTGHISTLEVTITSSARNPQLAALPLTLRIPIRNQLNGPASPGRNEGQTLAHDILRAFAAKGIPAGWKQYRAPRRIANDKYPEKAITTQNASPPSNLAELLRDLDDFMNPTAIRPKMPEARPTTSIEFDAPHRFPVAHAEAILPAPHIGATRGREVA